MLFLSIEKSTNVKKKNINVISFYKVCCIIYFQIQGLKEEILKATRNKTLVDSILGFRAPYLRVAGNVQYNVLRDFDFLYDTSILNINILQNKKPHWPFTLDHVIRE